MPCCYAVPHILVLLCLPIAAERTGVELDGETEVPTATFVKDANLSRLVNWRTAASTLQLQQQEHVAADAAVQDVNFRRSEDGRTATVSFEHRGRRFEHELSAASVFSDDAVAQRHTAEGDLPLDMGSPTVFRSRKAGSWATLMVQEDGSVSGLFEDDGHVVRVEPAGGSFHRKTSAVKLAKVASLLQTYRGSGVPHIVHILPPPILGRMRGIGRPSSFVAPYNSPNETVFQPELQDDPDKPDVHLGNVSEEEERKLAVRVASNSAHDATWAGTKWWGKGSCYPGDDTLHIMKMGILVDLDFYHDHLTLAKSKVEHAVAEASFVYEKQMNIELQIAHMRVYESAVNAPEFAVGCPADQEKLMNIKLDQLTAATEQQVPFQADVQLFTGCGKGWGTVGLAWIGTICHPTHNRGVVQFTPSGGWLVFAHELGHNFHAHHSFEKGVGKTGGIMDYGPGTLNGEYQFNTNLRKKEVCNMLGRIGDCRGKFLRASGAPPAPVPLVCKDSEGFKDKYDWPCNHWKGHDCVEYTHWWWKYDAVDKAKVQENCPKSCNLC